MYVPFIGPWISDSICHCGKILNNEAVPAIIGGEEPQANGIPWQVGVVVYGQFPYCGGTIIGPSTILTAAHCLVDPSPHINGVKVLVAEHDITMLNETKTQ